jgi:hypothetical protein
MSLPVVKTVPLLVTVAKGQRFVNDERCQGCCKERNFVVT